MSTRSDERGVAAVIVSVFVAALLFGLCAITVDVARMYAEAQRVQKAADVAASAGVIYMPQDLDQATVVARDVSSRNGYPNSGDSTVVVKSGAQPSQLDVAVSSRIPNIFGKLIGIGEATITRHAVADYTGPQPMGSPCNTFGNEPAGTPGAGPAGSQLSKPLGADCTSTPQFWMNVNGPDVVKGNGDQYAVRTCDSSATSGCTGTVNDEFDPAGYFYLIRVQPEAVGRNVTVQLFDPAFVPTEDHCFNTPTGSFSSNNWNDYTTVDAIERYRKTVRNVTNPSEFCTGDHAANTGVAATVTSFGMRAATDTQNPRLAEPITGCTRQFPGYTESQVTANALHRGNSAYKPALARVFHQWVTLCSFTPSQAGDYYLQVRTNVALGGAVITSPSDPDLGSYRPTGDLESFAMFSQKGDNPAVRGGGSNRFAVRAYGGPAGSLSVAALGKMSIYANSTAASTTFNLIRIMPAAAGQTLVFKFFDIGDAQQSASLTILPPTETAVSLTNCKGTGYQNLSLPTCSVNINSAWNGKGETVAVPIPSTYACSYKSLGGCWFRLRVNFPGGEVQDTTTWTAYVSGDPVRLIE